jgi:formyl-CoA transferase
MAQIMLQKTLAEWVAIFREHRVAGGPATPPEELAEDPHLRERGIIVELSHPVAGSLRMPGSPLVPLEATAPAPALGEHTATILADLGESEDTIERLRAHSVIA